MIEACMKSDARIPARSKEDDLDLPIVFILDLGSASFLLSSEEEM